MRKRILNFLLCAVLLLGIFPIQADAAARVTYARLDGHIYNGGIFDAAVHVSEGADRATYQWQFDAAFGEGSWYDLPVDPGPYGYIGSNTEHFRFITRQTDGSYEVGTGWNEIPFRCKVTIDGNTYYSQPFTMTFYTTSEFNADLKNGFRNGTLGITARNFDGISNKKIISESGFDTVYSGTATAGDTLSLWMSCKMPASNLSLGMSDCVLIPEIFITESGKTKHIVGVQSDFTKYTTSTVGTNAVKIEYKVRVKHGVNDLGYYQTETMNVTTTAPNVSEYLQAKSDCSVLKEMYNESEKLVSIPKNAQVGILGQSGSWYKVLYQNRIGYVPVSSLIQEQTINSVQINMVEPTTGQLLNFRPSLGTTAYTVHSTDWFDKTEDRFADKGDTAQKGHVYALTVWLKAASGYEFAVDSSGNPTVTGTLNGKNVTVKRAYEQDPEEIIELYYVYPAVTDQHVCTVSAVSAVAPTCTQTGFKAYYRCSCGKNYEDSAAKRAIADLTSWGTVPAKGHTEGDWRYNGTHHYRKCTECLSVIAGTTAPHAGGSATCQKKAVCDTCGQSYGEPGTHTWTNTWEYQDEIGHAYVCSQAACSEHDTVRPHVPGPAATETEPQRCEACSYILAPASNHKHTLTKVEAKEATCTNPGNIEYYICSGCSDYFKDANGTTVLARADVTVAPLGHVTTDNWLYDADYHWRGCTRCSTELDETKMLHELEEDTCTTCSYKEGGAIQNVMPGSTDNGDTEFDWIGLGILIAFLSVTAGAGGGVFLTLWLKKRKNEREGQ